MEDPNKKEDLVEEDTQNRPTKGEQCMLIMILTTLFLLLVFLIVFAIHLALVKHTVSDIFRAWNYDNDLDKSHHGGGYQWASDNGNETSTHPFEYPIRENTEPIGWFTPVSPESNTKDTLFEIKNIIIGVVFLNISSPRVLCNALKIKEQWSLVPGYCSAMWSDPYMTEYISAWLTRYYYGEDFVDLPVFRNVPHPHFDRNDFRNNIGLLEHYRPDKPFGGVGSSLHTQNSRRHFKTEILFKNSIDDISPLTMQVKRMSFEDCLSAIFAVATPRNYELCYEFAVKTSSCVDSGGFLQEDSRIIGFFSWMNRCPDMELPFVIITLDSFTKWITDTTVISTTYLEQAP